MLMAEAQHFFALTIANKNAECPVNASVRCEPE